MAVVRPTRSAPPYGLIVLAFTTFIATAVAVLFYLQVGKATADAAAATKAAQDANTKIAAMKGDRDKLVTLVSPSMEASVQDVVDGANAARAAANKTGVPLSSAVTDLSTDLARAEDRSKQMDARITEIQNTYDNNIKSIQADRDGLTKALDDAKAQNADLSKQLADAQGNATTAISAKEKDQTDLQAKYDTDVRNYLVQIQQLNGEISARDTQIDELKKVVEESKPKIVGDLSAIVDGKVIRTMPGKDELYIDLGRKDRISVGLTFAVYDPNRGIGSNAAKGKGQIEVIEVGDNQSLCRILHTEPQQTILTDDVIANVVYHKDRTRTYHFFVYGEFDLDGDGTPTPAERDRVDRMITAAGGVIDTQITTQTDFVVLGSPPGQAQPIFDTTTDQGKDLLAQRDAEMKKYTQVITDAKGYSVPVLNENRFLALIGYFNTTRVNQPMYGLENAK
jgi:hypothetical protein